MSKESGFAPIHRGLWEHVRDGRLSLQDVAVYQYIISQADTRTGIWKGSAGALAGELSMESHRAARHVLENLERGGYIRRFARPGCRFCYPILVHKFTVTQGANEGQVVNALASTFESGCVSVAFFPCQVDGEVEGQVSASQRRIENREERREHQQPPPRVTTEDSLELETKQAAFDVFWERWPNKQAKSDARRAWLKIPISEYAAVTAGLERWRVSDQWGRGIIPHPATWLNKKRWADEDIPQSVGGTNGSTKKLTGDDLTAANLKAAGFIQ